MLAEQANQRGVQIIETRRLLAGFAHVVPGFMRQPLHVVWDVGGEIDDRFAETVLRQDAAALEARVDPHGEVSGVDLLEAHHRSGLVERPARAEHPFHQRRFGPRKHIPDLALILDGGAQRILDRAAVERGDRLELVEGYGQPLLARFGDSSGQGKHFRGEARGIAGRSHRRE